MFNPGDIVYQKYTSVNKINNKDNKENRMSVILFEFLYNKEEYVCSCPITNHVQKINNFSNKFFYIPYQILNDKKYCSIKLDSINFYPKVDIKSIGLNLNYDTMLKVYNHLLDMDINLFSLDIEQCKILKDNIIKITKNMEMEEKKNKKEEKRLRKLKRKEAKQNYNIKKN